jgi:glycosyltransferase involved in cell wall biosynthesis
MNVLILVPWDQTFGGVAAVVNNLTRQLVARGHKVSFFSGQTERDLLARGKTKLGFTQFRMRLLLPFTGNISLLGSLAGLALFPLSLAQLLWLIRRERIDIINIHYPGGGSNAYFALIRRLARVKLVTSVHGADIFPGGQARDRYPWPLRFLLMQSDLIVANSEAFRQDFLEVFPRFRNKTAFIHNGIDWNEIHPVGRPVPTRDRAYILCVAAHNVKKAIDVLLKAFSRVAGTFPDVQLILVGDGPLRGELEQLASELQLHDRVVFAGAKDRAEVVEMLHGCRIFALPSRSEPFGIAVVEAMACGKPVIGTRTGGIPEIIDDGEDGLLVEPDNPDQLAEAILRLLSDASLRERMSARGPSKVRSKFLWEHTASSYERVFERLLT